MEHLFTYFIFACIVQGGTGEVDSIAPSQLQGPGVVLDLGIFCGVFVHILCLGFLQVLQFTPTFKNMHVGELATLNCP